MKLNRRPKILLCKTMTVLIIGANGVIGNALFKKFSHSFSNCVGVTSKTVPPLITVNYDLLSLQPFIMQSDVIIYCAGVTKFAKCESNPGKSLFLNVELPTEIIKNLSPAQTFLYFSSPLACYDFKDAAPNIYAMHKRGAEDALMASGHEKLLIIRPAKVMESMTILKEWKKSLSHGEKIFAFFDQYIAPISTTTLCEQLSKLIEGHHSGCYNFSARDRLSYLGIANALCIYFEHDERLVEGQSAREENPFFFEQDVLDCSEAQRDLGFIPPASDNVVHQYLQKLEL